MTSQTFKITGEYKKRGYPIKFTKTITSTSKDRALNTVYSQIGGNHKVKREQIKILGTEEIKS